MSPLRRRDAEGKRVMDPESFAGAASSFRWGAERAEGAEGGNHGSLATVISSSGLCAALRTLPGIAW